MKRSHLRPAELFGLTVVSALAASSAWAGITPLLRTGQRLGPQGLRLESFSEVSLGAGLQAAALADLAPAEPGGRVIKAVVLAGPAAAVVVAQVGGQVPADAGGGTFTALSEPYLSSTGHLAFVGRTADAKTGRKTVGLFAYADGQAARLIHTGIAVRTAGGGQVKFSNLAQPQLIGQELYFLGTPSGKRAKPGVYLLKARRVRTLVAAGDGVSGVSGARYTRIQGFHAGRGKVVFLARFAGGPTSSGNNTGIFVTTGASIRLIARRGVPWPQGPPTRSITGFIGRPVVAPNGLVAFLAEIKDLNTGSSGPAGFIVTDDTPRLAIGFGRSAGGRLPVYRDDGRTAAKGRTARPDVSGHRNRLGADRTPPVTVGSIGGITALAVNSAGHLAVAGSAEGPAGTLAGVFVVEADKVRQVIGQGEKLDGAVVSAVGDALAINDGRLVCFSVELEGKEMMLALGAPKPPRRTGRIITNHPQQEPGFGRQHQPRFKRKPKTSWEPEKPRVGRAR